MEVWRKRSGRSVAQQGPKELAVCRKLQGCLRVVEAHKFTGNPSDAEKMRYTISIAQAIRMVTHGDPVPAPVTCVQPEQPEQEMSVDEVMIGFNNEDCIQDKGRNVDGGTRQEANMSQGRKRLIGAKAAKSARKAKSEGQKEETGLQSAIESWTRGFADASSSSLEAAYSRAVINREQTNRDYELRKEADELQAVRVLFNDGDEDSKKYRSALKRKRLRKTFPRRRQRNEKR
ncbi:hypothetical protein FGB62_9g15 [Gracilaria domingensis]|nr:hypothetical protein FGB62_9g15 [Gracilaria domingensis]